MPNKQRMSEVRLIDANALKEHKFTTQICNGVEIEDVEVVSVGVIDNAPTITPEKALMNKLKGEQERPHGEWIFLKANEEQTDGYECSVCKATYHTKVPYFSEFNYCPNCGAKMKEAENE